ncbi:MAG TPA: DnaA/Hda family protein [Gemmatimonadales bacterium]|jgi:chromosomal replication initiation ATPase DnaA|nr:DnaA/Hda family protein [Gemmatimonadales bacterium]
MTAELPPQFRFEELVVGASNRLAVTAARAVAESPGTVYNPLFLYSRPGLGKTHLLAAVGHAARAIDARLTVEYLTLDEFVESVHAAIAAGQGDAHRRRFLDVNLLLLDDVQFLAGRREMQAELLRVSDAMQAAGRQIVLASDRPPGDIPSLDERLARRLGGGLVVDIGIPDFETRAAILRRRADQRQLDLAPGVIEAIAEPEVESVRELLGVLNRVIALQAVSDAPVTPDEARAAAAQAGATVRAITIPATVPQPAAAPAVGAVDEFTDFLQDVMATVSEQVESWRSRIAEAMLHWQGEGYEVGRLAALLEEEPAHDPAVELAAFEHDVLRLTQLRAEIEALDPDLADAAVLCDPDQLAAAEALREQAEAGSEPLPGPSPHWSMDTFIEGQGNRVAVRAARAVIEEPGTRYNPLVMVGATGNGKTHFLHAIGNLLSAGGHRVACASAHAFVDELIAAIEQDRVPRWRARWRRPDMLLLDDIQLLAGKERSQEELFLLFNEFQEQQRQMVFTSAVPLAKLEGIESRLLTRFEGGLVVELPPPDRELRQRTIERLLAARLEVVDPELANYVASRPSESMRATLGLVQRVLHDAEARNSPPTAMAARDALEGSNGRPAARRTSQVRASGVVPSGAGAMRNHEKMIWTWPDLSSRLIEEWR